MTTFKRTDRQILTLAEFRQRLMDQGVAPVDMAFICPICGTIQSALDFIAAGAGKTFDEVGKYVAFACVGRSNGAGPFIKKAKPPKFGCDWSLGGLFQLHQLEVVTEDGTHHPRFMPATPAEAQAHRDRIKP